MIILTEEQKQAIRQDGENRYPNECCGVMYGVIDEHDNRTVERIQVIDNTFGEEEQYHRFRIDADTMLKAELEARRSKKEIVGFYHSHPDHPAVPSEYDRAHALPVYSYVIISVKHAVTVDFKSYQLKEDEDGTMKFYEETVK